MERRQIDSELRLAVSRGEFELYYQPKVDCGSRRITGTEALLRWNHPLRGVLPPAEFLPVLEEVGLIGEVGGWVLREACRQLKAWLDAGLGPLSVAVNLSARQLDDGPALLATVRGALQAAALPPQLLELELTETALMAHAGQAVAILAELRQLGVTISVDDFGTGDSGLTYLKRSPLDRVKVDRSFIQDIAADRNEASITRAIITMAHQLKVKVVAEGVETETQMSLLVANQCDEIQGFVFSRPLPAAEMERMLGEQGKPPPPAAVEQARQRTLLLVDDEENILASLKRLLRRDGYHILTATGGAEALELLVQNDVDVILSDQRMPNMTGVEFLRRVKTLYPATVRMVLSGYTELQSITDAINEGAIYKFLTKPWDDELLRANIEEAFRYKEMGDENLRLGRELELANRELAAANGQLTALLHDKQRQLALGGASLEVMREILQEIPLPMIGVDEDGLIVFANQSAESLLSGDCPLLGADACTRLPEALLRLLSPADEGDGEAVIGGCAYRVLGRDMHGRASGRLLLVLRKGENGCG
ncbi:MAG: EAL domain-containing protein [Rhodocyclales bacterium]|nr:EAL domain-containing protein [Rhodocyclales bacterium]